MQIRLQETVQILTRHRAACRTPRIRWGPVVSVVTLLAATSPNPLAADEVFGPTVLRSLIEEADVVLDVTVESTHEAPGGLWQELRVHSTVWGESRGDRVRLFVHGSGIAETLILSKSDRVILGARWLVGGNPFEDRLLGALEASWAARAGLAIGDGVLTENDFGDEPVAVYEELRILLDAARPPEASRLVSAAELLALLDSPRAAIREDALRRLALLERLGGHTMAAICRGLAEEVDGDRNLHVLRAYLDLMRSHDLRGCDRALRDLLLEQDDSDLADEALDALTRLATERTTERLRRKYDEEEHPRRRGRILRFLARRGWHDIEELCRDALHDGDSELLAQTAEALGRLSSPRSAELLGEFLLCPSETDRDRGLDVLCRRRSPFDRMVLEDLIRRGELKGEALKRARRALDGYLRGATERDRG